MPTIELPRDAWIPYFDELTRIHEGRPASLDVLAPDAAARPKIHHIPLIGVSADRIDHDGTIVVSVASSPGGHFTHIIEDVSHVYVERTDEGVDTALHILSAGGLSTLLRLHTTPESGKHEEDSESATR